MENQYNIQEIELGELLIIADDMKKNGYRLVQISCTSYEENIELNYSFGKNYEFKNFKIYVGYDEEIPSLSYIYESAFLYENEMKDLFGAKIVHISVDYEGKLYKISTEMPFSNRATKVGGEEHE